jgi:hypothetical protein
MAEWVRREYGKKEIDRAGARIAEWWVRPDIPHADSLGLEIMIVQNWRSSHAMPLLTFRMGLAQRARRVEANVIVAQRLKRLPSMMNKLAREPNMKLSQMHDLGGCRAIVSDVAAVERLYELYRGPNTLFDSEGAMKSYDYLNNPKPDGYRGVHLVGRYAARVKKNEHWNGHRIEIQLRSRLQHAFATAVETVTTFTRLPLKFGAGPEEWRRFLSLMGSALAMHEGTRSVEGTPDDHAELIRELRESTKALRVRQRLRAWTNALRQLPKRDTTGAEYLLLVLDVAANTIKVTGYSDRQRASEAVAAIEKSPQAAHLDAVLVWVHSVRDLRSAYPNYYADTTAFVDALGTVLRA